VNWLVVALLALAMTVVFLALLWGAWVVTLLIAVIACRLLARMEQIQ
jgi:hypothetical protein